jgi:hypothetical protein
MTLQRLPHNEKLDGGGLPAGVVNVVEVRPWEPPCGDCILLSGPIREGIPDQN